MVLGFVETVHKQLFDGGCRWVKRKAAEANRFWHQAQKKPRRAPMPGFS
jgi:hypothetical protein